MRFYFWSFLSVFRHKKNWDDDIGAPIAERVIQDVYLPFESHKIILEVDGGGRATYKS